MNFMIRFAIFALLLCAPAWGAISTPTWAAVSDTSCAGTCSDTVTVPATTNGIVSVIVMVRSSGGAAHSAVTCSLGGESLTLVTDSDTTSTGSTTVNIYEGLQSLLTTVGAGAGKTLQCTNAAGANDLRSIAGHVVFFSGAKQQTAEAADGEDNSFTATTSLSVALTVSPGALILMGAAHTAEPGTATYTPSTSITPEHDSVDTRWEESAYRFEPSPSNPETVGLSWANSVSSRFAAVAYAPKASGFIMQIW